MTNVFQSAANDVTWLFSADVISTDAGDSLSIGGVAETARALGPSSNALTVTYDSSSLSGRTWTAAATPALGSFDPDEPLDAGTGGVA